MNKSITEIFCFVDEFCKIFQQELEKKSLPGGKKKRKPTRVPSLTISEIVTILIFYSFSPCKNFKFYYENCVKESDFPGRVSYNRFIELQPRAFQVISALASSCKGKETGRYFVDSTMIPVCHNKRIYKHKVFKNMAKTGKSTMGWFFGFKLHLAINERGEIMNLEITKANQTDVGMLETLVKNLCGKVFGDKGYISDKLFKRLLEQGLKLITGIKKNMKNQLMEMDDKLMLRKRSLVETVFDILKNKFNLVHTRHRSPINFAMHLAATLIAYQCRKNKPSISDISLKV
jgi:hypothetical protein